MAVTEVRATIGYQLWSILRPSHRLEWTHLSNEDTRSPALISFMSDVRHPDNPLRTKMLLLASGPDSSDDSARIPLLAHLRSTWIECRDEGGF